MPRIAVLNDQGVLIDARQKTKINANDIECGDLPADASYRYVNKTFVAIGHGYGKPKPPPFDRDRVVYLALRALLNGQPLPQECADWCDWYNRTIGE